MSRTGCATLIGLCVVVAALLSPVPAFASTGAAVSAGSDRGPVAEAVAAANAYWGAPPCGGSVAIRWQTAVPASPVGGTTVEAWVSFLTPQGPLDFAAPPQTYSECVVNISRSRWPTRAAAAAEAVVFCQMMVHEFGHLEGYSDSLSYSPTDVRYPILTAANVPDVCRSGAYTPVLTPPRLHGFERPRPVARRR